MDVFAQFATDEKKEVEGVWVDIGDGAELLIARAGNKKYARLLGSEVEKHQRALDAKGDASDELSERLMVGVFASTILLGWRGDFKFKGEALPYTNENARKVLGVKDFRAFVAKLSNDIDAYRAAQEATAGKN
jgi:hypothetical protein